jgi:threonine/homoserine/homoserine lactone efflux protein
VASLGFFRSGRFSHTASLGLSVGSFLGVPLAYSILKYVLDRPDGIKLIRWLVTAVVIYAAVTMLRSAHRERAAARAAAAVSH